MKRYVKINQYNGAFRDETYMYGESKWDQNRHRING